MPRFLKILFWFIFIAMISLFICARTGYALFSRSIPQAEGSLEMSRLSDQVTVYRDGYHVPYIMADCEDDLYYVQGFITAQDRFWQMDYLRRLARGRLAEILGPEAAKTDSFMLKLGLDHTVREIYPKLSIKTHQICEFYSHGINDYINQFKSRPPLEYRFANSRPTTWSPQDCFAILRLYGWLHDSNGFNEIIQSAFSVKTIFMNLLSENLLPETQNAALLFVREFNDICRQGLLPQKFGPDLCRAIPAVRSKTGKPFVVMSAESPAMLPSPYYEIHLKDLNHAVHGFTLPGVPLVLFGFNDRIAWGYSTGSQKTSVLKICSIHSENIQTRSEKIIIFKDTSKMDVHYTDKGPVLVGDDIGIVAHWNGYLHSDELSALYQMNHAVDLKSFKEASETFKTPALLFVSADSAEDRGAPGNSNRSLQFCREIRVDELIAAQEQMTVTDAQNLLADQQSLFAKSCIRHWLDYAGHFRKDGKAYALLQHCSRWDGHMLQGSMEPLIFHTALDGLVQLMLKDTSQYALFQPHLSVLYPVILSVFEKADSSNNHQIKKELAFLLQKAFANAYNVLSKEFGENPEEWSWGAIHQISYRHPFHFLPAVQLFQSFGVQGLFEMGAYSVGGAAGTPLEFQIFPRILSGYDYGPSAKMVVSLADPDHAVSIVATGQSGQMLDAHYQDQLPLFIRNCYHPNLFNTSRITQAGWDCLLLKPGENHEHTQPDRPDL